MNNEIDKNVFSDSMALNRNFIMYYKGRIALYEVMPMTEELREFVLNGASTAEIKREAIRQGMMTLRASGLLRLKEGLTTVEEVLRVTAAD